VGHEIDVTIADLVADQRAPTPSAAAERAVPDRAAVLRELNALQARMAAGARRMTDRRVALVRDYRRHLDGTVRRGVDDRQRHLRQLARTLDALSPLAALGRGYAVPLSESGHILRRAAEFEPGRRVHLRVIDGVVDCTVDGTEAPDGVDTYE
jgi:exodeoxyribonuclease VII large subunit